MFSIFFRALPFYVFFFFTLGSSAVLLCLSLVSQSGILACVFCFRSMSSPSFSAQDPPLRTKLKKRNVWLFSDSFIFIEGRSLYWDSSSSSVLRERRLTSVRPSFSFGISHR